MPTINRAAELLAKGLPVFYVSTRELSHSNGLAMAHTWADLIRSTSNTRRSICPRWASSCAAWWRAVPRPADTAPRPIAELPTDGTDEAVMRANSWMVKQALAQGLHGILLCHAETPGAARVLVEAARYSFQEIGVGDQLGKGRRGNGGQTKAAGIWGLSESEYLRRADAWPLNPDGELILGLKIENLRALANAEQTLAVPGLAFAEWGPGDMGMALGFPEQHDPPYPQAMLDIRERVRNACHTNKVFFLDMVRADTFRTQIDEGVMVCGAPDPSVAALARRYAASRQGT